jgi:hypothetical protein
VSTGTNDLTGVTRAAALYWNLVPQDVRHDLLIRCLQHTTPAGCIDALVAAYDEKEIGEIIAELTALCSYLKGERK